VLGTPTMQKWHRFDPGTSIGMVVMTTWWRNCGFFGAKREQKPELT
jgi:hypothetical protein